MVSADLQHDIVADLDVFSATSTLSSQRTTNTCPFAEKYPTYNHFVSSAKDYFHFSSKKSNLTDVKWIHLLQNRIHILRKRLLTSD